METEWFYKPIEGYNRRYIRVGEFRKIHWCETHDQVMGLENCLYPPSVDADWGTCVVVDKWLEV